MGQALLSCGLILAAALTFQRSPVAGPPFQRLTWHAAGKPHTLLLAAPDKGLNVGLGARIHGSESSWKQGEEEGHSARYLLSVVGPMVSTYEEYSGYHGVGGWVTEKVRVEFLGDYRFSVAEHLKQAGLLKPTWPSSIEGFWVDSWNGKDRMTVGLQISGCDMVRSSCSIETERVTVAPPREWVRWLEDAKRGRGVLNEDLMRWWSAKAGMGGRAAPTLERQPGHGKRNDPRGR
jgi:hypothetical protein